MRTIALVLLLTAASTTMASGSVHATGVRTSKNQPNPPQTHVVVAGESLSTIATDNHLPSWRPLWNANTNLQDPDQIEVGEQLVVPTGPTADRPLPSGYGQPAAAPAVSTASSVGSGSGSSYHPSPAVYAAAAGGDLFARIRARESGGNYADNTGNGYYGAYQFSQGTWQSVGGSGNPASASPAEQDLRAQLLYAQRGCSPWPQTCY